MEVYNKPSYQHSFLKKPVRFKAKHDIMLLKCVIAKNPFACRIIGDAKYLNEMIAEEMNKAFEDEQFQVCHRRVRERYNLLLRQFQHEDLALHLSRKRSKCDTDEENKEKIQLLQECTELQFQEEKVVGTDIKLSRKPERKPTAIPIKLDPTEHAEDHEEVNDLQATPSFSMSPSYDDVSYDDGDRDAGEPSPPVLKRMKKSEDISSDLLDYFQRRDADEMCYKEKELELKERELRLKERELELRERELKWKQQQVEEGDSTGKAALLSLLMKHLK